MITLDNAKTILFKSSLSLKQKVMVIYITLGNIAAPAVVIMTIFGFTGWFLGEPSLFNISDLLNLLSRFAFTAGFLFMGIVALWKLGRLNEVKYLVLGAFTVGIVLAMANTIALTRAVFNKGLHWYCTPKAANVSVK